MGWGGEGCGTHIHPWVIRVNVWQKPPQYCKVISLQLKKEKKNVACSLKCTGEPIFKTLTFKSVAFSHSYRDKKVAEQRITFVMLGVYRNTMT